MVLSIILALSLVLFFTVFILLSWSRQHGYKLLPPGPTPIPVLGTPQYMDLKNLKNFKKLSQEYGSVYTIWRMSEPVIVLCGFEAMKDALINHAEQFSARPIMPVNYIFSKGYDIAGPRWRPLRRFTVAFLKELGMGKKTMEMRVLEETKFLIQAVLETGGKPFNPTMSLSCALGNNITVLVFGEHFDYQDKTLHELLLSASRYIKGVNSPFSTLCNMVPVLLKIPTIRHKAVKDILYIQSYVTNVIKYHKENFNPESPKDYIDHFLLKMKEVEHETDPDFCDISLIVVAVGFLAGGVDTTSSTLKFMLTLMAHLPDVQAKVHREIDEVSKSLCPLEIRDKTHMPFTNAVIHETQRVVDIAPTAFIHATTEEVKFRGYTIPKGTSVIPFLTSVLTDPSQWETPDEFNPGHFLDEDGQFRKKLASMPFSVGKRACPGEHLATMQLFLFFTSLLQKFTFTLPPGTERRDSKFLILNKYQILAAGEICAQPRTVSK